MPSTGAPGSRQVRVVVSVSKSSAKTRGESSLGGQAGRRGVHSAGRRPTTAAAPSWSLSLSTPAALSTLSISVPSEQRDPPPEPERGGVRLDLHGRLGWGLFQVSLALFGAFVTRYSESFGNHESSVNVVNMLQPVTFCFLVLGQSALSQWRALCCQKNS